MTDSDGCGDIEVIFIFWLHDTCDLTCEVNWTFYFYLSSFCKKRLLFFNHANAESAELTTTAKD